MAKKKTEEKTEKAEKPEVVWSGSEPERYADPVTVPTDAEHGAQWHDSGQRKTEKEK
jgi:hypothetical protein